MDLQKTNPGRSHVLFTVILSYPNQKKERERERKKKKKNPTFGKKTKKGEAAPPWTLFQKPNGGRKKQPKKE